MNRRFFLTFERVVAFAAIRSYMRSIIEDSSLFMAFCMQTVSFQKRWLQYNRVALKCSLLESGFSGLQTLIESFKTDATYAIVSKN